MDSYIPHTGIHTCGGTIWPVDEDELQLTLVAKAAARPGSGNESRGEKEASMMYSTVHVVFRQIGRMLQALGGAGDLLQKYLGPTATDSGK